MSVPNEFDAALSVLASLGASDWISIITSFAALAATIIIASMQIRQSNRMEAFERRQDERDELRHEEGVRAQAVAFISKYYPDRGLIPLCAIAAMHNSLFYYSREMYREFCCLTTEAQNRILEYCELDLRVEAQGDIFQRCIDALTGILKGRFPDDSSVFYDGGKYVLRSLERYSSEKIPVEQIEYQPPYCDASIKDGKEFPPYETCIDDVLGRAFDNGDKNLTPISDLERACGFRTAREIEACQFVTETARIAAIYGSQVSSAEMNYGCPGGYADERIETMEDLFLHALFEMYTRLILEGSPGGRRLEATPPTE